MPPMGGWTRRRRFALCRALLLFFLSSCASIVEAFFAASGAWLNARTGSSSNCWNSSVPAWRVSNGGASAFQKTPPVRLSAGRLTFDAFNVERHLSPRRSVETSGPLKAQSRSPFSIFKRRKLRVETETKMNKALARGVPLSSLEVSGDLRPQSVDYNLLSVLRVYDAIRAVKDEGATASSRKRSGSFFVGSALQNADCVSLTRWMASRAASTQGFSSLSQRIRDACEGLLRKTHPVVAVLHSRRRGSRPLPSALFFTERRERCEFATKDERPLKAALAVEGGAMRGCVSAGMAVALHYLGFADCFDAVYGSSAGSLIGAYFISRQLAYEGIQIYYDWLPKLGGAFLDVSRIGRGLGLGCITSGDVKDLICNRLGKPTLNLDALLVDIFQRRQPLNAEAFFAAQERQPLKVVASGLSSLRAVILDWAHKNFTDIESLALCMRASMLLPGLAGPAVRLPVVHSESTNISAQDGPLVSACALPRFSPPPPRGLVSEPLADALLFEPLPYRSAIREGNDFVLVLRSRPDGLPVQRLRGIEAAIENRLARRFFLQKHGLRRVYEHVVRRGHRAIYMRDMLRLNSASNNHELVVEEALSEGGLPESRKAFVLAVALAKGNEEVKKLSARRAVVLEGVRKGFAAIVDALEPIPEKAGRGAAEALKVFPEDLPLCEPLGGPPPTPPPAFEGYEVEGPRNFVADLKHVLDAAARGISSPAVQTPQTTDSPSSPGS